ncbi:MAG: S-layer homology domain-containing protein [Armatimonadetes bacterium]|nr:S-layer homology domain-containing protein [Armatimonadota bacterium]
MPLVCLLLLCTLASAGTFSDVPADHWAAASIEALCAGDVLQGNPDGLYRGQDAMVRNEYAVLACRLLAQAPNYTKPEGTAELPFSDVRDGHWATAAIAELYRANVVQGTPDGLFKGDQPLGRYDFAALTARLLEVVLGPEATQAERTDKPFADVPADHWAAPGLRLLLAHRILQGTPDEQFQGEKPLARYDFAVAGARLLKLIYATRPAE